MRAWILMGLLAAVALPPVAGVAAEGEKPLLRLNSTKGVVSTWGRTGAPRKLDVVTGPGNTTDGDGALRLEATSTAAEGNHYFGVVVPLPRPTDIRDVRLLFDARTTRTVPTRAFYVRCYNKGETEPAWSFHSWSGQLRAEWRTFSLQAGLCLEGLTWEPRVVGPRVADRVDRIEFIIGTHEDNTMVDVLLDNLRTAERLRTIQDLAAPKPLTRDTVLVRDGKPAAIVLHPDTPAGRDAASVVVRAVAERTGATLPARVGTPDDRQPAQTAILLGSVDSNPALLLLYARYLTPVDSVCPGRGGSLVHTVFDPFGKGANAIAVGASDDAGLAKAAAVLAERVAKQPKGATVALPRLFERGYGADFLKRFGWADDEPLGRRLEAGLALGQRALDRGRHTSIAGVLRTVAQRYQLTGHSVDAKLFVALWDMYGKSAVADPRKYGGPWGFDSDFPSSLVVAGWDTIEHDPALTDAERLRVTQTMARWLAEAVIPKCRGAATSTRVPHNHQTFPGLGALFAGIYFTQGYTVLEGPVWLGIADAMFPRQAGYFKPYEDCNGYQWLTNGHLMRYAVARPDFTLFENGNGKRIIDYCLGTMDNLGYQVPYGDTGSWKCWNSEMICLDIFAFATRDPAAAWAAGRKREIKNTRELYAFYHPEPGARPDHCNGVRLWPLEPQYYESFKADERPPLARCFDKISFREAMDPQAAYLLLDGLSNGGHKHLDGNSLPRLTQFDRIWLADNDYFKSPVKFHNSMMVFADGQSAAIPEYAELLGAGESPRCGWSRTRLTRYAGADWDRAVLWLKPQKAFVVLDRLVARESGEYQFRLLWHGVGAAKLTDQGLRLTQEGPTMWIQPAPGPTLRLVDDHELGKNWSGYPHAEPVVRSLGAIATVRLEAGQSYLYATAIHGAPDAKAAPWRFRFIAGADAVVVATDRGDVCIALGPTKAQTDDGLFDTDAQVTVADGTGLSLLGATRATFDDRQLHASAAPASVDIAEPEALPVAQGVQTRPPTPNLVAGGQAPPHPLLWEQRPQPERLVLTGNKALPGTVDLGVKLTSDPAPAARNAFNPAHPNTPDALLDGQWGNSTATSVMYEPDKSVTLTVDLGTPCRIGRIRWMQWWSTTSSKKTAYLLHKATASVSSDAFANDTRQLGVVTDDGPHPDFGSPLEYAIDAKGPSARWVRLVIEPKPGTAVYLAQLIVEGKPEGPAAKAAPYHFTRLRTARLDGPGKPTCLLAATVEGALLALNHDGTARWTVGVGTRINDIAAADLNRDGRDEIILACQDTHVRVLDPTGKELWKRQLPFYRRPPYANVALAGDLDGDGTPEVIVGGENWRFHAFKADGTELWNYESVHPSRSGAVADLDGDGKAEVVCGTHYYWMSVLNPDGTRRWRYNFGPICYDIATGSFDNDRTRGVVFGGGDGCVHYVGFDGKPRLNYNTGDEVKHVAAGDLDGDGRDEILAGSMSHSVYCFGADAQRRWRVDLGAPITALAVIRSEPGALVLAGTAAGRLVTLDGSGRLLAASALRSEIIAIAAHGAAAVLATADGRLRRLAPKP